MKTKRKQKGIALLIVMILLILPVINPLSALAAENAAEPSVMSGENWMGFLPNEANLNSINLPATHDSGTTKVMEVQVLPYLYAIKGLVIVPPLTIALPLIEMAIGLAKLRGGMVSLQAMAKDQDLSIKEQLNCGARMLDCRLSNYKGDTGSVDDLEFSHGGVRLLDQDDPDGGYLTMNNVLKYAKEFVKANPTETVVLTVKSESFFPLSPPESFENEFVQKLMKVVFALLEKEFNGVDLTNIGKNAKPAIKKMLLEELPKDPDVLVLLGSELPTVGEARGKVIVCQDDLLSPSVVPVKGEKIDLGNWNDTAENKWTKLKTVFNDAHEQEYNPDKEKPIQIVATNCTGGGDGPYMENAILALLEDLLSPFDVVKSFFDLIGLHFVNGRSGGEVTANYVNPKLKDYSFIKGKYYGWIASDFMDATLAKKIYSSNIFDFDIEGAPINYISEIKIAYDQKFEDAKSYLEKNGYTVFKENFNEEGPDKSLSDAIINGVPNNGSFNMAVGYKTSPYPKDAVTGLIWAARDTESQPMDKETQALIRQYGFKRVELSPEVTVESKEITTTDGLTDFNIGTKGKLVNLYYTRNSKYGERLIDLKSIQGYTKTRVDPINGKEYRERDIAKSQQNIEKAFNNAMEMPRNISEYVFGSNIGRYNVNDVFLVYDTAFNHSTESYRRFAPGKGEHAHELYEWNEGGEYGGGGFYNDIYDETGDMAALAFFLVAMTIGLAFYIGDMKKK